MEASFTSCILIPLNFDRKGGPSWPKLQRRRTILMRFNHYQVSVKNSHMAAEFNHIPGLLMSLPDHIYRPKISNSRRDPHLLAVGICCSSSRTLPEGRNITMHSFVKHIESPYGINVDHPIKKIKTSNF
jgi:hypothetical protein